MWNMKERRWLIINFSISDGFVLPHDIRIASIVAPGMAGDLWVEGASGNANVLITESRRVAFVKGLSWLVRRAVPHPQPPVISSLHARISPRWNYFTTAEAGNIFIGRGKSVACFRM